MDKQKDLEAPIEEIKEETQGTEDTQAVEVEVKPKRVKKPRTQKQIDAFEKARLKRLENIKNKKKAVPKPKEELPQVETTPPTPPKNQEEDIT